MSARCPHVDRRGRQCLRTVGTHRLHVYVALPRHSRKGYRKARLWALDRARGRCEATALEHECDGPLEVHHILKRSQGGSDDPDNLLVACAVAHRQIHENPSLSEMLGLLRRRAAQRAMVGRSRR